MVDLQPFCFGFNKITDNKMGPYLNNLVSNNLNWKQPRFLISQSRCRSLCDIASLRHFGSAVDIQMATETDEHLVGLKVFETAKGQLTIGWCLLFTFGQMTVDSWWLDMIGWFKILPFTSPKIHKFVWLIPFEKQGLPGLKSTNMNHGLAEPSRDHLQVPKQPQNAMKIISPAKNWSFKKLSATKTIQSLWLQISF